MKRDPLDDLIRDALSEEEQKLWDQYDAPSISEQVLQPFLTHNRLINVGGMIATLVFMAISVFSLVRFLGTTDVLMAIRWAALLFFTLSVVWALKLWFWMEMERTAITREFKRLELQLLRLLTERGSAEAS